MSQPARLSSSLLARKGEAVPAGGRAVPPPFALAPLLGAVDTTEAPQRVALTVRLDPNRHTRLRIYAARHQTTSQEVMVDALDALLAACGEECACVRGEATCRRHRHPPARG